MVMTSFELGDSWERECAEKVIFLEGKNDSQRRRQFFISDSSSHR